MTRTENTAGHASRIPTAMVPDRAIGAFFAIFPIAVIAFLSVQAIRVADMLPDAHTVRPAVADIAR